ncbi:unnamed protein product [Amoebophrya sp. A120]|nr:unnamed protein product [Amoebophrya sp. A120]|eukprot:GSA120T00019538001.1
MENPPPHLRDSDPQQEQPQQFFQEHDPNRNPGILLPSAPLLQPLHHVHTTENPQPQQQHPLHPPQHLQHQIPAGIVVPNSSNIDMGMIPAGASSPPDARQVLNLAKGLKRIGKQSLSQEDFEALGASPKTLEEVLQKLHDNADNVAKVKSSPTFQNWKMLEMQAKMEKSLQHVDEQSQRQQARGAGLVSSSSVSNNPLSGNFNNAAGGAGSAKGTAPLLVGQQNLLVAAAAGGVVPNFLSQPDSPTDLLNSFMNTQYHFFPKQGVRMNEDLLNATSNSCNPDAIVSHYDPTDGRCARIVESMSGSAIVQITAGKSEDVRTKSSTSCNFGYNFAALALAASTTTGAVVAAPELIVEEEFDRNYLHSTLLYREDEEPRFQGGAFSAANSASNFALKNIPGSVPAHREAKGAPRLPPVLSMERVQKTISGGLVSGSRPTGKKAKAKLAGEGKTPVGMNMVDNMANTTTNSSSVSTEVVVFFPGQWFLCDLRNDLSMREWFCEQTLLQQAEASVSKNSAPSGPAKSPPTSAGAKKVLVCENAKAFSTFLQRDCGFAAEVVNQIAFLEPRIAHYMLDPEDPPVKNQHELSLQYGLEKLKIRPSTQKLHEPADVEQRAHPHSNTGTADQHEQPKLDNLRKKAAWDVENFERRLLRSGAARFSDGAESSCKGRSVKLREDDHPNFTIPDYHRLPLTLLETLTTAVHSFTLLFHHLYPALAEHNLVHAFENQMMPFHTTLAILEKTGMPFDPKWNTYFQIVYKTAAIQERAKELVGRRVNLASSEDCGRALFEDLQVKLPAQSVIKRSKVVFRKKNGKISYRSSREVMSAVLLEEEQRLKALRAKDDEIVPPDKVLNSSAAVAGKDGTRRAVDTMNKMDVDVELVQAKDEVLQKEPHDEGTTKAGAVASLRGRGGAAAQGILNQRQLESSASTSDEDDDSDYEDHGGSDADSEDACDSDVNGAENGSGAGGVTNAAKEESTNYTAPNKLIRPDQPQFELIDHISEYRHLAHVMMKFEKLRRCCVKAGMDDFFARPRVVPKMAQTRTNEVEEGVGRANDHVQMNLTLPIAPAAVQPPAQGQLQDQQALSSGAAPALVVQHDVLANGQEREDIVDQQPRPHAGPAPTADEFSLVKTQFSFTSTGRIVVTNGGPQLLCVDNPFEIADVSRPSFFEEKIKKLLQPVPVLVGVAQALPPNCRYRNGYAIEVVEENDQEEEDEFDFPGQLLDSSFQMRTNANAVLPENLNYNTGLLQGPPPGAPGPGSGLHPAPVTRRTDLTVNDSKKAVCRYWLERGWNCYANRDYVKSLKRVMVQLGNFRGNTLDEYSPASPENCDVAKADISFLQLQQQGAAGQGGAKTGTAGGDAHQGQGQKSSHNMSKRNHNGTTRRHYLSYPSDQVWRSQAPVFCYKTGANEAADDDVERKNKLTVNLRECFRFFPAQKKLLVSIDYCQLEVRLLAFYSRDPKLQQHFLVNSKISSQSQSNKLSLSQSQKRTIWEVVDHGTNANVQNDHARKGAFACISQQDVLPAPSGAASFSASQFVGQGPASSSPPLPPATPQKIDLFRAIAADWLQKPIAEIGPEERSGCKKIVYGMIYGMGARKISQDLQIDLPEAKRLIESFFQHFPNVKKFITDVKEAVLDTESVTTLYGRKRFFTKTLEKVKREFGGLGTATTGSRFQGFPHGEQNATNQQPQREIVVNPAVGTTSPYLSFKQKQERNQLVGKVQRQAVNTLCQASAADLMMQAMLNLYQEGIVSSEFCAFQDEGGAGTTADHRHDESSHRRILWNNHLRSSRPGQPQHGPCHLLLQIHDELLFSIDEDALPTLLPKIVEAMTRPGLDIYPIPLEVKCRVGKDWGNLNEIQI